MIPRIVQSEDFKRAHREVDKAGAALVAFQQRFAVCRNDGERYQAVRSALLHSTDCPGSFSDPSGLFDDSDWTCPFCQHLKQLALHG